MKHLPVPFPAPARQNQLVFDGSSITSGGAWLTTGMDYPSQLMRLMTGQWQKQNKAVSGSTTGDAISRFAAQVAPLYSAVRQQQALIVDFATNDLLVESASVATVKSRIDSYMTLAAAAGFSTVFIRPISDRLHLGNFTEANRQDINAWLLSTYPTQAMDQAVEPRIFGPLAPTTYAGIYFADTTHPNDAGAALEAAAMKAHLVSRGFCL